MAMDYFSLNKMRLAVGVLLLIFFIMVMVTFRIKEVTVLSDAVVTVVHAEGKEPF